MLGVVQAASASEAQPRVVVLVAPLVPYVAAIMQGGGTVSGLLQPGQDPHHFAMAPSQAEALDGSDILILPDLSMSPMTAEAAKRNPKLRVIELSKLTGAAPLPYAADNPWLAAVKKEGKDEDDDAPASAPAGPPPAAQDNYKKLPAFNAPVAQEPVAVPTVDPHFWLDPERMAAVAPSLAEALGQFSPEHRATYAANAAALAQHLRREVLPGMRALLDNGHGHAVVSDTKPVIGFITYHAAYQYFLARFGLGHTGEITARPEDYLGAKSLDRLLEAAKKVKVRCIIGEADSTLVNRIAALSGAKVILLSPEQNVPASDVPMTDWVHDDYDRLLYKTAQKFGECL